MAAHAANDRYDRKHEAVPWHDGEFADWAKERDDDHPFHYRWGVNVWVSSHDLTPDDSFI